MAPPLVGGPAAAASLLAGVTERCHHRRPAVSGAGTRERAQRLGARTAR